MRQILVNAIQSEVYGVFGLVVHANAYQYFDTSDLGQLLLHHLQTVNETVPCFEFTQQVRVYELRIVAFAAIIYADGLSILEERNLGVIDPLIRYSGAAVHIDGGVYWISTPHVGRRRLIWLHPDLWVN